jgi:flagellin
MVALQTLSSINKSLGDVQSQISTGLKVGSAKDNAAVFAISQVMRSDVEGFNAISDSLALGSSTLAVGADASESVGDLLNEIKGKIVSANEDNVDRTKIQDEISSLVEQIEGVVSAAQFNGLNLVDGSSDGANGYSVLSSLDRSGTGVTTSNISFDPTNTNLSTTAGTDLTTGTSPATTVTDAGTAGVVDAAASGNNTFILGDFLNLAADGSVAGAAAGALSADNVDLTAGTAQDALIAGDVVSVDLGDFQARYTVREGDVSGDITSGLRQSLVDAGVPTDDFTIATNGTDLTITNLTEVDTDISFSVERSAGGLAGLAQIDVTTDDGARSAVSSIEGFIQTTVDAQAQFGTTQKRVEIQADFMSNLVDNFTSGIGALVDANLEQASAKLQALQVQQQLGTQALSIANQAPQSILSLFR